VVGRQAAWVHAGGLRGSEVDRRREARSQQQLRAGAQAAIAIALLLCAAGQGPVVKGLTRIFDAPVVTICLSLSSE
jgi:hypothetical protein